MSTIVSWKEFCDANDYIDSFKCRGKNGDIVYLIIDFLPTSFITLTDSKFCFSLCFRAIRRQEQEFKLNTSFRKRLRKQFRNEWLTQTVS